MPSWPSVEEQFAKAKVISGNALDKLIRDNQDFHLLRPEEADDNIGLPPWLRVYWRKQHPEGGYSADDPTGGYPRVLKNIHTWMLANQNLQPSPPPGPGPTAAREALAPRAGSGAIFDICVIHLACFFGFMPPIPLPRFPERWPACMPAFRG
jgi:hypothetical protein